MKLPQGPVSGAPGYVKRLREKRDRERHREGERPREREREIQRYILPTEISLERGALR